MQDQEIEVSFCELCGTSVPAADLAAGKAVRHQNRTIGDCCLPSLRGAAAPAEDSAPTADKPVGKQPGSPAAPRPSAPPVAAPQPAEGGKLLTMAVIMLAAVAGGVIFLDSRIARLQDALVKTQNELSTRQQSDSEVLMGLSLELGKAAKQADVIAATQRVEGLDRKLDDLASNGTSRQAALVQEIAALRAQMRGYADAAVDYRPMFEDLRRRQERVLASVASMRSEFAAVPASATPRPDEAPPPASSAPTDNLPAALAELVVKLSSEDSADRFEAVDKLFESKNPDVLVHLLPLAKDPDSFVRRLLIENLRDHASRESIDVLVGALMDEDFDVRDTAWGSLRHVTKQSFPFAAGDSRERRTRAAKRWQEWWAEARATFGS